MAFSQSSQGNLIDIQFTHEGCDQQDERRVEACWDQLRHKLEAKIAQASDAATMVRFAVERVDEPPEWSIQSALHLTGHTLTAVSSGRSPESPLDAVIHDLAQQIDKHDALPARVTTRREGTEAIVPLLEAWRSRDHSNAFLSFLTPVVVSLSDYVDRELQLLEAEETSAVDEIQTPEALNEVLIKAWNAFPSRDKKLPVDLWLVQLVDQSIERLARQLSDRSLHERRPRPATERAESERDQWIEHVSYPDTVGFTDLLAAGLAASHWDDLDMETKQAHLNELFRDIPRPQRQSFAVNVVHGFSTTEIADFQDRQVEEVKSDIGQAEAAIRRHFIDEHTADQEEPFVRRELRAKRH